MAAPIDPAVASQVINSGTQVGTSLINTALGMITQNARTKEAMRNQEKLMDIQVNNQKLLDKYGQQLQMQTWEQTNYPAQVAMMKKAGLNPALIYSKGGVGGVTGSQSGGSASGGNAPNPQPYIPMDIANAMKIGAEISLIHAQQKAVEATTPKTEAETKNVEANTAYTEVKTEIERINLANRDYQIKAELGNIAEEIKTKKLNNSLTEDNYNSLVKLAAETAIGKTLENDLTISKTKLTDMEKKTIATAVVQKWTELKNETRGLSQKDEEIKIQKAKAEFETSHPGIGQVGGRILDKAYNNLKEFSEAIQ